MLSSTTLPTAMASPARLIKLRVRSASPIRRTPVKMLNGIDMAMISVGRRDRATPLSSDGRRFIKKAATTRTAKTNPIRPSRNTVSS